ncbi:hypothetical protein [Streptosporangium sp. CA-115845]|uniref:hypothetical protein n=1 Tax=Streptosporangium sp. CA-115845 TaxID=3240071 RepID=UPI003D8B3FBF
MNSKLAAVSLGLALSIGGIAQSRAAGADATPFALRTVTVTAPGFYAGGTWRLYQSNGFTVTLNLTQDSSGRFFGTASYPGAVGTIEQGSVDGRGIFFIIAWANGAKGRYAGTLGSDKRLSGTSSDLNHPSSQATWFTTRVFS